MEEKKQRIYVCIDLKSFYASVECVERGLDPFTTNLVVADPTRCETTICLAITPRMKELGVKNRCRVFEIPKNISYLMAPPRMKLYMQKSAEIYGVYLRYVSPDDVHVYSIDECFIDATDYLKIYEKTPKEFAKMLMDAVFEETGICATAGIGTNLFLAKVALDITAKHVPDHMGWLDEMAFKRQIWHHRPITDVWNIGAGIATRLKKYGIEDLFGVTQCDEDLLYREFGVNAELLIDHAWGREPCTIADIHAYKTKSNSLSNGQVLMEDYTYEEGLVVLKEMVHSLTLDLVEKGMVTNGVSLSIGYAHAARSHTGGSKTIPVYTNSHDSLWPVFLELYEKTTDRRYAIKRLNIGYNNIVGEEFATYDLLTDVEALQKENSLQKTLVGISKRYGKNAILRGVSFEDKATARERNKMIGGHRSGEDDQF